MRRLVSGWRRRAGDDRGFSLVEVVTAVSLMTIVGASLGSTLTSHFQATAALERGSQGLDELRISVSRIEKEFRSAECVYEPVVATPGGSATGSRLRFKTRLNAGAYEVTYRIEAGTLYRTEAGGDQVVATQLVDGPAAFTLTAATRRRLDVKLTAQPEGDERQVLETSVAGRNAWRDC